MRVFVAGGAGVIGRRLVPQLVARGHQVTATTTSVARLRLLEQLGADGVVMDGLDAVSVKEAVASARPDAIVHEMTALSAHNGKPNFRHPERLAATTNRLRTEGTDHLLAAAQAGVSHVVAQSVATWTEGPDGGRVSEEDPLPSEEVGPKMRGMVEALRRVEDVVGKSGGAALRYGAFYGPGANDDLLELVRKRRFPLVGDGTGYFNWVHLDDAASATVLAVEQQAKGVFNIVDDEPAQVRDWLPYLAESGDEAADAAAQVAGALLAGEMVKIVTQGRAFSNAKASGSSAAAALSVVAAGFQERIRMTRNEEFEKLRPLLFAIAYRILGSVTEAEDAVQETWLRYQSSPTQPTSPKPSSQPWSRGFRSTCCARRALGGRPTSDSGSPSHYLPTPMKIRRGQRSSRTRCQWRPCCCSSG